MVCRTREDGTVDKIDNDEGQEQNKPDEERRSQRVELPQPRRLGQHNRYEVIQKIVVVYDEQPAEQ